MRSCLIMEYVFCDMINYNTQVVTSITSMGKENTLIVLSRLFQEQDVFLGG